MKICENTPAISVLKKLDQCHMKRCKKLLYFVKSLEAIKLTLAPLHMLPDAFFSAESGFWVF